MFNSECYCVIPVVYTTHWPGLLSTTGSWNHWYQVWPWSLMLGHCTCCCAATTSSANGRILSKLKIAPSHSHVGYYSVTLVDKMLTSVLHKETEQNTKVSLSAAIFSSCTLLRPVLYVNVKCNIGTYNTEV